MSSYLFIYYKYHNILHFLNNEHIHIKKEIMEMEELYDRMSELLDQASNMCNEVMISNPYDAIDALTDLMEESGGYDTQIGDLIDDIAQTMEDIDSMESEEYFRGGMDESKKSKKKIIRLSESDLQRIVKRVIRESRR
jgi:5'-deoxynucleotidase YfbR-like HD superfamily hydrolase